MSKFFGKIEELQALIAEVGCEGQWEELPNQVFQFTTPEGGVVNWWQKTKTVQFQGPPLVKTSLEKRVANAISEWKPAPKLATSVLAPISAPVKNGENK